MGVGQVMALAIGAEFELVGRSWVVFGLQGLPNNQHEMCRKWNEEKIRRPNQLISDAALLSTDVDTTLRREQTDCQ